MAIYKHVSSKEIIRKVFRDLKPPTADWIHDSIEWMGEALEHIGASSQLCQKQCVLNINDHKAALPSDLYYINQVSVNTCISPSIENELTELIKQIAVLNDNIKTYYSQLNENVTLSTSGNYSSTLTPADLEDFDSYHHANTTQLNILNSRMSVLEGVYFNSSGGGSCFCPLQYGTSTFHDSLHCEGCVNMTAKYKDTYIVNCGMMQTSFVTGQVCISYMAFPTDENCWPMVPDDISYREAMFWYIVKQMTLGGAILPNNRINYEFADMKWQNYCTQARNAANYPDIDRYQNFMDQWVRMTPDVNRDQSFFQGLNDREHFTPDNI